MIKDEADVVKHVVKSNISGQIQGEKGEISVGLSHTSQNVIIRNKSFFCKSLVGNSDKSFIEGLRAYVRAMYLKNGYNGFSDDYDRQFDSDSAYFYVTNNSGICAVQRVIHKTPENLLPIENANICNGQNNERYVINELNVVEITSFVFSGYHVLDLLFSSIAHYGKLKKIKKAFALLDLESNNLSKIYCKVGWRKSEQFSSPIFFPGYGRIINGKFIPTLWKIMELPEERIISIAENVKKYEVSS